MSIDFRREEYRKNLSNWTLVDDMVNGENLGSHLIKINPTDTSADNAARNRQYMERASFLGVSGFTLAGLIGTAFAKEPEIELPLGLEYAATNLNGSGVGLAQHMQRTLSEVLKKGRAGLFVTFPDTGEAGASLADMEAMKYVSTVHLVDATRIINWRTSQVGAESILSLVVFAGQIEMVDGYEVKAVDVRRELALEEGVLVDRTWIKNKKHEWVIHSEAYPRRGDGSNWTRIPFQFVGSVDNNAEIDKAPMLDIARKNRDHYRNSADHEESVWFCGQAQPWASGLTVDTVESMKADGFYVGSRWLMPLADGGSFGFAAAPANTMVRQAMLDKIDEMASIGARMIRQGTVAKTATQAAGEMAVQHSILSLALVNVQAAYLSAMRWVAEYMNVSGDVRIEVSREFMNAPVTAQDISAFKDLVLGGLIGPSDAYRFLSKHDLVDPDKSADEYLDEIDGRATIIDAGGL